MTNILFIFANFIQNKNNKLNKNLTSNCLKLLCKTSIIVLRLELIKLSLQMKYVGLYINIGANRGLEGLSPLNFV